MTMWTFDPAHSEAAFSTRHMMIATVRGHFKKVSGTINFDPSNPAAATVEAHIDASSIETGVADRDNHLRSADFLDVGTYPTIIFKSTKVEPKGDNAAHIHGDLTIRGKTLPVVLDAELIGVVNGMDGKPRAGFSGSITINREDWGLTWNVAIEAGGVLVGKDIKITLDLEAIPVEEAVTA